MQMRGGRAFRGPAPRPPGLRGSCSAAGTVKVAPIGRDGESARRCGRGRGRGHREPRGLPRSVRPSFPLPSRRAPGSGNSLPARLKEGGERALRLGEKKRKREKRKKRERGKKRGGKLASLVTGK